MAKIDELSELLVEELNDFKLQITKLETLSLRLKSVELKPDISELTTFFDTAIGSQRLLISQQNNELEKVSKKLSISNTYPKWLIVILSLTLLSVMLLTSFSIYQLQNIPNIKLEERQLGQQEIIEHFNEFLESDEKSKKAYIKWNDKKN